jgi:zinc transport system permease protein
MNAIITAILASICCGIIGSYIIIRKMVFISGGITHASFGGIGIAWFLGINPLIGASVFAILSSVVVETFSKRSKINNDAIIGMMWALGMAIGIIFIYLTPGYTPNLMSYLFGNILSVTLNDNILLLLFLIILAIVFVLFNKPILYLAFDKNYAETQQKKWFIIDYILMIMVSICIVMNIRVIGIVLLISFLTIPQITASVITSKFNLLILYSCIIGIIGSFLGLFVSYKYNIPSGATIIFCFILIFLIVKLISIIISSITKKRQMV